MKTILRSLAFATACALSGLTLTGCATLSRVQHALTGHDAALTVGIVGLTAKTAVEDAAKLKGSGVITPEQFAAVAAAYDRFLLLYNAEVAAIAKANASANSPASSQLADLFRQVIALYNAAKAPAAAPANK
jgi:hypothetical protein